MLTQSTIKKMKSVGFSVKKAQEAFLAVIKEAVEELGGKNWKKTELPALFRQLEKETVGPLCQEKDGPQLSTDTYKKYMSAAKKSLLFGIPFRMGWMVSYNDIPAVKKLVDTDRTRRPMETKVKEAIKVHRDKQRVVRKSADGFYRVPLPDLKQSDKWVAELLGSIAAALDTPEAQIIMRDNPELRKLAKAVAPAKKKSA